MPRFWPPPLRVVSRGNSCNIRTSHSITLLAAQIGSTHTPPFVAVGLASVLPALWRCTLMARLETLGSDTTPPFFILLVTFLDAVLVPGRRKSLLGVRVCRY